MQVGGKVTKAQNGITYKNLRMGVNNENEGRETKPTKQDSMAYEAGYNSGKRGSAGGPNDRNVVKMGRWEGQNDKPKSKPYELPFKQVKPAAKKKMKMGGTIKAKSGGSFPDLNKDGKITKADILKGRGVIAKKGASVKAKGGCLSCGGKVKK